MLLVLQIAQYEAVALEVKKLLLVLFWTVFRIMQPGHTYVQAGHTCVQVGHTCVRSNNPSTVKVLL